VLRRFGGVLRGLEALPVPVVAAVGGLARAGGFELILACDLAVAADEARIGDVHTSFGVPPGGGSTQRAPRRLGPQRAAELIFTGRWLSGTEAAAYGLALVSVPRAGLDAAVEEVLDQLRAKPRPALATAKAMLAAGRDLPLAGGLDAEIELFVRHLREHPEAREGLDAFLEGRRA
jgi:enoyl-CoA hydratase/carnithine racemase